MRNCRLSPEFRQVGRTAIALVCACVTLSGFAASASEEIPATLAKARLLRDRGRFDEAVQEYCRLLSNYGQSETTSRELERMLMERFPAWIERDWYSSLPLAWSAEIHKGDETKGSRPFAVVAQPAAYLPSRSAQDPVSGAKLACSAYVYVDAGERFPLCISVFSDDAFLARGVAVRAARVVDAARQSGLIGKTPKLRLCVYEAAEPSGATLDQNIRLECSEADLGTFDLYRVLAHEMGHALLPQVCGFSEPEPCADGYLGEVLFLTDDAAFAAEEPSVRARLAAIARERSSTLAAEFDAASFGDLPDDLGGIRALAGAILKLRSQAGGERVRSILSSQRRIDKDALFGVLIAELKGCGGDCGAGTRTGHVEQRRLSTDGQPDG